MSPIFATVLFMGLGISISLTLIIVRHMLREKKARKLASDPDTFHSQRNSIRRAA